MTRGTIDYRFSGQFEPSCEPVKTLRDEFALVVLPQCMADELKAYGHIFPELAARATAKAYECADAMLAARQAKEE